MQFTERDGRRRPHHDHCHGRGRGDKDHARFGGGREGFGPGFGRGFGGGGRERMFDGGEFQLVILNLLAEKPSYGYELIKTLEEKLAGGYAPSPGVVYPTLTMLEEEGLTAANTEGGRKVYSVTDAGRERLAANKARLDEILGRLQEAGEGFERGRAPEFMRSFKNLQRAVMGVAARARFSRDSLSAEKVRRITEAIDAATKAIDEI